MDARKQVLQMCPGQRVYIIIICMAFVILIINIINASINIFVLSLPHQNDDQVCGVHLNGMFRGRDPCPGPEENYSSRIPVSRPRKYLTVRFVFIINILYSLIPNKHSVRFSCVDVNKSNVGLISETTERSRRNHINKVKFPF